MMNLFTFRIKNKGSHSGIHGKVQRHYHTPICKYDEMVLDAENKIPPEDFTLAGFCSWLLLAGFLVSPSTYASFRLIDAPSATGKTGQTIFTVIRNIPILYIASFFLSHFCYWVYLSLLEMGQ